MIEVDQGRRTMNEAEWLTCTNHTEMLHYLRNTKRATDRKLRLFAVACCKTVWHLLSDTRSRQAVELAEQHAEGVVDGATLAAAREAALAVPRNWPPWPTQSVLDATAAAVAATAHPFAAAKQAGVLALSALAADRSTGVSSASGLTASTPVNLVHEIFGNPFRAMVIDQNWLTRHGGTPNSIAQAICDDRRFNDLPILADALEDAGCDHADILDHCRNAGPHCRGCWVLDLMLGRH